MVRQPRYHDPLVPWCRLAEFGNTVIDMPCPIYTHWRTFFSVSRQGRNRAVARIDLDSATLPEFERRVIAVSSTAQRQWGTMSLAQMFAHLRIVFEISLEERETKDESRAWLMPFLWIVLFRIWTNWPKGIIKASPQFLNDSAEDIEAERSQLIASMRRFVERSESNPGHIVLEPMLGRISLKKWQRVHGVHSDYHLRQFGA